MNKDKIKELMQRAGTDTSGKWMGVEHAEVFAQLIVAECVAQCEKNKDHEWLGSGSKLSAFNIREHFGVKE